MTRRLLTLSALLGLALAVFTPAAHASTSTAVAYVTDFGTGANDASGPGFGSSIFVNALTGVPPGVSYTTADLSKTVTVTDVPVAAVDAGGVAALTAFDTVILYQVCDIASHPATMSAINTYLTNGDGKVMIFDADRCSGFDGFPGAANYSTFLFPFTASTPGPQGATGSYTFVESSTLTAGLSTGPQPGDAVGDANTFVTFNPNWCGSITATNVSGNTGFVEAYARTPNGGFVVYQGEDFWFTFGPTSHLRLVFDDILKQNWHPDGLPCSAPASLISLAPASQTVNTGSPATVTAHVADVNNNPASGVTVNFSVSGPATPVPPSGSAVTDASGNASFTFTSAQTGTDTVQASFTDTLGNVHQSNTVTVTFTDQPITATGTTFSATEGASFTGTVANFTDPDRNSTASEYAATIDWGDGSTSAGTISGPTGGPFTVSGTHTYADEGTYTVTVTITDVDTASNSATATSTANVADAVLTAGTLTLSGGVEGGSPANASFSFSDANTGAPVSDFTATIDWGDGSTSPGTVSGGGGSYTVTDSHTYAEEGSFTVTVTVNDDGGSSTSATGTAKIADAPLAAACAAAPVSPQSFSGNTATFTDADPNGTVSDYTATIDWGDASTSGGTVSGPNGGPFAVSGSHTYSSTGFFTITTTVTDHPSTATAVCKVLVFAFAPGAGSFVIGDLNSANGTAVTFWGAQWWKLNSLSGGAAPASFKGFAEHPKTASCGTDWSTDPGNSTPPPAGPLPAFMGVIVSSSISKAGSQISGNTPHIVVVKTNPGYAPNPGHAGTGTVVAQVC